MAKIKRISANIPEDLLKEACLITGSTLTETLIQGLILVKRAGAFEKAKALQGKLSIKIDLDVSRERRHS
jgi:hypothetical protein